ncbi:sugar phosphate isomerase/epimerase [Caldibacillus lycopersici]|uniref:Sugar phosphate isomerase/epimerase n=1 Tax=Perspicuibacillus lycopersici TaxID=1325689 RepID=A0AAE3IUT1_9BACI|nr:sugar phosphate isomerase/epimerase family protein [Perspicuibacillus lycopersici]MCU9614842.1 sugar phosphate isomerase/epimerase [Perspicuibacillus lycopersici]
MKLGCCASIDKAETLYQAGYDFIECTVLSLKPEAPDTEFQSILKTYEASPIPVATCNILFPRDMKIVGENVNDKRLQNYLTTALERVAKIGADTIVFGSGGARSVPVGFSREKAEEQIIQCLNVAADIAEPLQLTIVIEPLNRKESNIINSIPEAIAIAKKVNRKSIQVLADFYHMEEEGEAVSNIVANREFIKHIHVADTDRLAPGTGKYPFSELVDQLKLANYNGRVSIECNWQHFDSEVNESFEFLRKQFQLG